MAAAVRAAGVVDTGDVHVLQVAYLSFI